jgi:hypothetical protein
MPTFLTHPRLSPALAKRIEASVSGRNVNGRRLSVPTVNAVVRLIAVSFFGLVITLVVNEQHSRKRALAAAKEDCLASMAAVRQRVPAHGFELRATAESWLSRESSAYAGDVPPGARSDAFAPRTSIYIRAALSDIGSADGLSRAAADSRLDAFTYCWHNAPPDRAEKVLMKHLLQPGSDIPSVAAGSGGAIGTLVPEREAADNAPASIFRFHDLTLALDMLRPQVTEQLMATESLPVVQELGRTWALAKVDKRVLATHARLLLAVLDEPKTPGTPVELDGAADQWVRVLVVDLARAELLLRRRIHLDPTWVTERRRPQYASRLLACRLAFDVRNAGTQL